MVHGLLRLSRSLRLGAPRWRNIGLKSPGKKGRNRSGDKKVIFRRDGERYIVFLGDDRIGFVRRADNGTWNHADTTMAHPGYAKTRERAGHLLLRRYERMAREGVI
jgi:hypothetical protein